MPHALQREYYCEGCAPVNPPKLEPTKVFCDRHYITREQLNRLLRRKVLICKKFKGRNFVALNPAWLALGIDFQDVV
jgi:hypothetical protein